MTPEQAEALRKPFPPELIGKLPKAGMKLDYVGHAAVTDRLLQVDPEWTWRPLGGVETIGKEACLWIELTVAGVTRPGVGTCAQTAGDLPKQLISDALRNAAMRFGVALDLWAKEDLHVDPDAPQETKPAPSPARSATKKAPAKAAASVRDNKDVSEHEKTTSNAPQCGSCGHSLGGSAAVRKSGVFYHSECVADALKKDENVLAAVEKAFAGTTDVSAEDDGRPF